MTFVTQVEKEEVRLRRTVGLKKDEYQLNKKKTRSLLFSVLSTPYFSAFCARWGAFSPIANNEHFRRRSAMKVLNCFAGHICEKLRSEFAFAGSD